MNPDPLVQMPAPQYATPRPLVLQAAKPRSISDAIATPTINTSAPRVAFAAYPAILFVQCIRHSITLFSCYCAAQSQRQQPLMAERCPNCFQNAMDKLWFQQNVLLLEPPCLSLQSLARRMKPKAVLCSRRPPPPECSTSVWTEKSSSKEVVATARSCRKSAIFSLI